MEQNTSNQPAISQTSSINQVPANLPPKSKNVPTIVIIFIILIFLFGLVGGYWFVNKKAKTFQSKGSTTQTSVQIPTPTTSPVVTTGGQYKITGDSVYKILQDGKQELIITKTELKDDQAEIMEISSFQLSPDKSKILLFTNAGITPFILFYKDINNKDAVITKVGFGEEAVWSPNNQYIAFTNRPADVGPLRLYVFDTLINKEVEIIQSKNRVYTSYRNMKWSPDSKIIIAQYETFDDIPYGNVIDKGETQIAIK